ncbi:MAG: TetR/AcrR family transcriptional regulator [Candidatus Eremiobacteraeota bacterium]|nr:TetR/AcrR family transcriptional regulator [Candidatus Eremiobacteraeota bacterium]
MRKNGIDGLRTADVAAAAGVSQGAQFHHFPNKEALVLATLEFVNARMIASTRAKVRAFDATADPIEAIVANAKDFFMSDYFFVELAMGLSGKTSKQLMKRVRNQVREARFEVENVWKKRLEEAGLSPRVAADILDLTFNMVRGLAVRRQLDPNSKRFAELYVVWRRMIELYVRSVEPDSAFMRGDRGSRPRVVRAKAQKSARRV